MIQVYSIQLYFEFNIDDNVEHTRDTWVLNRVSKTNSSDLLTTIQSLRGEYLKKSIAA